MLLVKKISMLPETESVEAAEKMLGVALGGVKASEVNCLVADHAAGAIYRCRINTTRLHAVFDAGHKEGAHQQLVQPGGVALVALIHRTVAKCVASHMSSLRSFRGHNTDS